MIKLEKEHIHLFLDEPIYVLHEHFESTPTKKLVEKEGIETILSKGGNKKGILIINEDEHSELIKQEDEQFLFKGLNALEIVEEDILIVPSGKLSDIDGIYHKVIRFSQNPEINNLYKVISKDEKEFLECESISIIRPNIDRQKKFWIGLKQLFGRIS